jgi:hypothetical protein
MAASDLGHCGGGAEHLDVVLGCQDGKLLRVRKRQRRVQSEAVVRVLASDLALDKRVVIESLGSLREQIAELSQGVDEDERRAPSIAHRERQLKLVRSLGRRLLQAHLDWIEEVQQELGEEAPQAEQ